MLECIDGRMKEVRYERCVMKVWRRQYNTWYCTASGIKERRECQSWMMKCMLGLNILRYRPPKRASIETERVLERKKTWIIRMEGCA